MVTTTAAHTSHRSQYFTPRIKALAEEIKTFLVPFLSGLRTVFYFNKLKPGQSVGLISNKKKTPPFMVSHNQNYQKKKKAYTRTQVCFKVNMKQNPAVDYLAWLSFSNNRGPCYEW